MKLSIIISVYNSHEILRRQFLHWERIGIPDDVEILIMDDESNPPLEYKGDLKLKVIKVGNPRVNDSDGIFYDGRVSIARNLGAKLAQGEFLLMTDIDYIITKENIEAGRNLKFDKCGFRRELGVILEDGTVTQDMDVLKSYGLVEDRAIVKGVRLPPHTNNFVMRKSVYLEIGGYRENLQGAYPSRGDTWFKRDWEDHHKNGKYTIEDPNLRTTILMFPNGRYCGDLDYNPHDLFHGLSRKTKKNPYHHV